MFILILAGISNYWPNEEHCLLFVIASFNYTHTHKYLHGCFSKKHSTVTVLIILLVSAGKARCGVTSDSRKHKMKKYTLHEIDVSTFSGYRSSIHTPRQLNSNSCRV